VLGGHAEDYYSDKTLEDADVLYSGMTALPTDFWERHGKDMRSWKEADRTFYENHRPGGARLAAEPGVFEDIPEGIEGIVRKISADTATIELTRDHRQRAPQRLGQSRRATANRTSR